MWQWIPVITVELETCANCQSELLAPSKAYIKVWWPYKEWPSRISLFCERCGPQVSETAREGEKWSTS